MKLRSLIGISSLASALVVPLASNAAALPVFDNWTVSAGNISPGTSPADACPAGFSCETLTTGNGFIQRQLVDTSANVTYIQTIITDTGVSGAPTSLGYRDESFVRLGGTNGILSQQSQSQTDTTGVFTTSSRLANGWANPTPGSTSPNMEVTQSFTSAGGAATGDEFSNTFHMLIVDGPDGNPLDQSMSINQQIGLGDGVTASTDAQRFVLEERKGNTFVPAPGSLALAATSFDSSNNALNGGTVTWAAGDDVMVRWIGQRINMGDTQGISEFGYEGVTNNTDTANPVDKTTFSTTSAGITPQGAGYQSPFDWNSTFGATAPTLP